MDRLTVVRSLTHPYPLHGTVYATTGIPNVDTKIEPSPGTYGNGRSSVRWWTTSMTSGKAAALPDMPRNVALPFVMGAKNRVPAARRAVRRDARDAIRSGLHRFHAGGNSARRPKSVPGRRSPIRSSASGRPTPWNWPATPARAADLRREVRAPSCIAGAIRPCTPAISNTAEDQATFGQLQQMAFALLATGKMHAALDYTREPTLVRDAYGMTLFGQSCLAARRLIEAGTKFVTVIWDAYGLNAGSWDTHHNHFPRLKEFLLPVFDQAFSALILDLEQRGLLDETLVLVISEHGRTPLIDRKAAGGGRDHWSRAYSQVYAGGGMGRGNVVGATDQLGGDVVETAI